MNRQGRQEQQRQRLNRQDAKVAKDSSSTTGGMPTDLYYAGLDGTWDEDGDGVYGEAGTAAGSEGDLAPDVCVGRIPVRTTAQAYNYINKVIQFDTNPIPPDRMFLMGVHIGVNAPTPYTPYIGPDRPTDVVTDGHSDFASHSPISDVEMWTRRMFRDKIQPYWQPATLGLFFDTLTSWDTSPGNYGLGYLNMRARVNDGWHHIFMMTHGYVNKWQLEGVETFTAIDAGAITGRLGVIYSGSCQTGRFDDGETDPCLSEAFLRDGEGPVAYFGCSREGWYSPNKPPASNYTTGGTSMDAVFVRLGDINGDQLVDVADVLTMAESWEKYKIFPGYNVKADLNSDGWVNVADLQVLATHWNQ